MSSSGQSLVGSARKLGIVLEASWEASARRAVYSERHVYATVAMNDVYAPLREVLPPYTPEANVARENYNQPLLQSTTTISQLHHDNAYPSTGHRRTPIELEYLQ